MLSGIAKLIDPEGFVIKLQQYLAVWQWHLPEEALVVGAIALSLLEFIVGISLAVGAFRRTAPAAALAMMAVMLPLTLWIVIKNPVSDCGCFGDLLHISNTATFLKNILITALLVYLVLPSSRTLRGIIPIPLQWTLVLVMGLIGIAIAMVGYIRQPLVDFRPYPVGSTFPPEVPEAQVSYTYSRDGQQRSFSLDSLPDSTWTFVEENTVVPENNTFEILDSDSEDIATLLPSEGTAIYIVVPQVSTELLHYTPQIRELRQMAADHNAELIFLLGDYTFNQEELLAPALARNEHYSAAATNLRTVVRGNPAVLVTHNGIITIKSRLGTIPADDLLPQD